jgi:hypothetical protein
LAPEKESSTRCVIKEKWISERPPRGGLSFAFTEFSSTTLDGKAKADWLLRA